MIVWRQRLVRAWLMSALLGAACHAFAQAPVPEAAKPSTTEAPKLPTTEAPKPAAPAMAGAPSPGGPPAGPPPVPVSVAAVVRKDTPVWLRGLGTVQALQSVQVRARVDGTLMRVPVTEGQDVKQGDLLAVIDPRPYQAILDAALAKKRQDEALLSAARADMARYAMLAEKEIASRQKLEATTAQVGQITAVLAADEAQIDAAKLNLAFCYITAPFDGRVGLRAIDPGNLLRAAEVASVMPLAQLRPIAVMFTMPQDTLPAIQRAMAAGRPRVVAFASDDKTELDQGVLLTIDNAIDAATGTIKVKAIFPNAAYKLWPGQFTNARLLIGAGAGALIVPSGAVQHGQDRLFVFVVKPDQTVVSQTVELERDDGVTTVIAKGLEEGQRIVTEGHSRLRNGSRVVITNAPKPASPPAPPPAVAAGG